MKTEEVLEVLKNMHDPRKWAFFEELRIGTGYGKDSEQRFDAWAIHYYPSKRNVTRCYELKVSKSDFMHEVKKPFKRRAGLRLSNEFYFVTPKGLLSDDDINKMPECGLMEVDKAGLITTRVKAAHRSIHPPNWLFLSSLCRRFDKGRLGEFMHNLEEDKKLQYYGDTALKVVGEGIERWKNYSGGSKEIPDKIADALQGVYHEIIEAIELNRKIK